jgi:hypothetical protein
VAEECPDFKIEIGSFHSVEGKRLQVNSSAQSSLRSIACVADVSFNTIMKLLIDAGRACAAFHDETVRDVKAKRVQCDEIWSFTYAKACE